MRIFGAIILGLFALTTIVLFTNAQIASPANGGLTVDTLDATSYLTWIAKSVCVTQTTPSNVIAADPYGGCPAGTGLRKIQLGDPLPYNNTDQYKAQISDSIPYLDLSGKALYMHTFDWSPFNQYNQYDGSDGYDVFSLIDSSVSFSNTKDGGGYGSAFFGANCSYGNAWVLFPQTNFMTAAQAFFPIQGVYWEQNQQSPQGACPTSYNNQTLTSWQLNVPYAFGGVNGNPVKTMNAMVSYHGLGTTDGNTPLSSWLQNGHLEVYYFTREYGLTRWEVWSSIQQNKPPTTQCNVPPIAYYKNQPFMVTACHDWSIVQPLSSSSFYPSWPLVNSDLLAHSHFDAAGFTNTYTGPGLWNRFGNSPQGKIINWSSLISTNGGDNTNGSGMSYLATNCASTSTQCSAPGSQAIYQDIPISTFSVAQSFLYGVNARSESGMGTLQVALQLISSSGKVLWQDVVQDTNVLQDNGDGRNSEITSVFRSAKFISHVVTPPSSAIQGAAFARFLILPITTNTFDVVDAYVNPFPTVTGVLTP